MTAAPRGIDSTKSSYPGRIAWYSTPAVLRTVTPAGRPSRSSCSIHPWWVWNWSPGTRTIVWSRPRGSVSCTLSPGTKGPRRTRVPVGAVPWEVVFIATTLVVADAARAVREGSVVEQLVEELLEVDEAHERVHVEHEAVRRLRPVRQGFEEVRRGDVLRCADPGSQGAHVLVRQRGAVGRLRGAAVDEPERQAGPVEDDDQGA